MRTVSTQGSSSSRLAASRVSTVSKGLPRSDCSTEFNRSLFIYFEPSISTSRTAIIGDAKTMSTNEMTPKTAEPVIKNLVLFRIDLLNDTSRSTSAAASSIITKVAEVGAMFTVSV
ncbi:unannotated protein [freshwater metagenome]|uniref:Unannotated protein n=1 Tax=freshwater metagenome TaxID=449393 RepID=A0A6J6MCB8_9ZZZZ